MVRVAKMHPSIVTVVDNVISSVPYESNTNKVFHKNRSNNVKVVSLQLLKKEIVRKWCESNTISTETDMDDGFYTDYIFV